MAQDDRIFRLTRVVAVIVVPFLVLAFIILYFFPSQSGERFAWQIKPNMTAMFIGAGYLGGSWLFVNAIFGRRWHRVQAGFPAVSTFTVAMLIATVLHWDRFDIRHFPFDLWLVLYVVTPFLVPFVWLRNRVTDPGTPEPGDVMVPAAPRWGLRLLGLLLLLFAVAGFVVPSFLAQVWPWALTPLTSRVLAGWFALLGVGGLVIGGERRWSAWRVGLECIGLWHVLVVIAAILNPADFGGGVVNWYTVSVVVVLVGMSSLYAAMEYRRRDIKVVTQAN
jgi:hypothetical protein